MKYKQKETSFLNWKPAISAEEVYNQTVIFQFLFSENENLFWIEVRPEEAGRAVIVGRNVSGKIFDVIPFPYSARSRVFEYGGHPYTVKNNKAFFVNFTDQRIYMVDLTDLQTHPVAITQEKTNEGYLPKYSELSVSDDGNWLLFSYEIDLKDKEPKNAIGIIDLRKNVPQEASVIVEGADFYKNPKFSPDSKKISWIEWNHPFMPWNSTKIFEANFDKEGKINGEMKISGSEDTSISDSCYLESGELVFAQDFRNMAESDSKNFYNLYLNRNGHVTAITNELFDFQQIRSYGNKIFAQTYKLGKPQLVIVEKNGDKFKQKSLLVEHQSFTVPIPTDNKVYFSGITSKTPSQLYEIDLLTSNSKVIKSSTNQFIESENVSKGRQITFPTTDGETCYGYYYPPTNKNYIPPKGELPPVRVLVHGGPTGMATLGFSKQLLFWTSQGYAVFDVNYRGSFGYGRRYRDALLKKWGILEIQDVKDGLAELKRKGLVGGNAVVSGGSAGGYTVQRLLTFYPELFAAGASHFGIGNLITLQKLTHKFESHYLEQLIGGTLETNLKEYENRSPINHLNSLKSPMIIFQGSDDKVVPPENSREMAEILKKKGIHHEYYEYQGEGHGFRKMENLIESLNREALFFKSVLGTSLGNL